ncbi:hypothetical protein FSST1_002930 [Fusarium sambucinum]
MEETTWNNGGQYDPGSEFQERALAMLKSTKWDRLLSIASTLRNGIPCVISESFSLGQSNIVRRLEFTDGINWVARVRMPALTSVLPGEQLLNIAAELQVEVASLKTKTSIPVPEVHFHSVDPTNDVGAPYILMDYIHGTTAKELRDAKNCHYNLFGTPQHDRRFREQMAEIQVQLSTFKFDKIGSLYYNEETSDFSIGAEVETGKGPWTSSNEFYVHLADHALHACKRKAGRNVTESPSFENPILFKRLMPVYNYGSSDDKGFGLVNRDFGDHNLIVDDEFRIVSVIDFDGLMAAPIEVVAQYPNMSSLHQEPPGHVETIPLAIEVMEDTKLKLIEYKEMVKAAESRMGGGTKDTPIADLMMSDTASVYQGLWEYRYHSISHNTDWMVAYKKLLINHVSSD